jgi:antitoxin (DNA-binding transcriptional repressor) of toxin-antitoxin stability system
MKMLAVGELKAHFSAVLSALKNGQAVTVGYGKSKRKVAVLVPYRQYRKTAGRKLGLLENLAQCRIHADFSMSDEKVLSS